MAEYLNGPYEFDVPCENLYHKRSRNEYISNKKHDMSISDNNINENNLKLDNKDIDLSSSCVISYS